MKHLFELILRLPKKEQQNHPEISKIAEMGRLHISTNSIVVCDPLYYYNSHVPLEVKVPNGDFVTELYYANEVVRELQDYQDKNPCFALVRFSDKPVKYWKMAVSAGQNTENFGEGDYFGYPVESGMGCFKDEKATELYTKKNEELIDSEGDEFSFYSDYIDLLMEENDEFDFLNYLPSEEFANNVILFSIGTQNHFPSYFGFDDNNQPVCLVTDFFIFDDKQYYKYLSIELKQQTEKLIKNKEITNLAFADLASDILKQLFNNSGKFNNPLANSKLEVFSNDLYSLISKYTLTGAGSFITLSTTIELVKCHSKNPEYLIDLVCDMILISMGENVEFEEKNEYEEESEKINALTYEIVELESQGFYEEAIEKIDFQLSLVEELNKKTFLIYDKMAVLNNKAYYLYMLSRLDEALDVANKAILEYEDAPELYHTRAEIFEAQEKYDLALNDISKSIAFADSKSKQDLLKTIFTKKGK
jgi:tetratricopeptide (TPR) repeat protein